MDKQMATTYTTLACNALHCNILTSTNYT